MPLLSTKYQRALDETARRSLSPVSLGLGFLYVLYGLAHLRVLAEGIRRPMAGAAFASAALLFGFVWLLRRWEPPLHWANILGAGVGGVVLFNSELHLLLTWEPQQTTNHALLILGAGLLLTSSRWLLMVLGATLAAWLLAVHFAPPSPEWGHFAFNLLGATAIAVVGHVVRVGGLLRAETLRREADARGEALKTSEERYALAVAGSNDGIYDWDLERGEVHYSSRWKELQGFGDDEIGGDPEEMFARVHPDDMERVRASIVRHLAGETPYFEEEYRVLHKDGSYRWMLSRGASIRNRKGEAVRMAGSLTDITRRGVFDPLTGLPNRILVLDRLERMMSRSSRYGRSFSLLFLDLDRFKMINDSLGHQAGDDVLMRVADRLLGSVRGSDTVGRLGGDEFVIILEDLAANRDMRTSIDRIEDAISGVYVIRGREVYVSASIGAVLDTETYDAAEELLRDADNAMYRAKERPEACVVFDVRMREEMDQRLRLEAELRMALRRGEFMLRYQPIVDLATGHLEGLEALVRWNHPERGIVGPREFIPLMEETGMIVELGGWVLHEACSHMSLRCSLGGRGIPVSVNLSSRQLADEAFVQHVSRILTETGLAPELLQLEMTESVIIANADRAAKTLRQLQDLGVGILMDDFGTGHSSLGYLHNFPIDALKIDQSFIEGLSTNERGIELVRTIINLAQNLGIRVVAEGIETREQLKVLQALDCALGQGYLFAMPAEFEEASVMHDKISERFRRATPARGSSEPDRPTPRLH